MGQVYPPELQLDKANSEAQVLDLNLSISNGFVSSKIDHKRDDFNFHTVKFPFWLVTFPILPLTGFTFPFFFD